MYSELYVGDASSWQYSLRIVVTTISVVQPDTILTFSDI
jgi:hypothetical protein